ncbi:MAG TPA: phenylalanine--tRNA ligase subunit beta [Desulfobulbaceae bacterium]|nr:phenylalanine--tRNA ligase subunit beta [Desulfobulbaceae bacterium]
MKLTFKWLNEYVNLDGLSAEQIADRLTMLGLEVDAVVHMAGGLEGLRTARIRKVLPHPDADRLTVCEVEVGAELIQVVCGAPNAREGLLTAIARPGVILPNGMKIRKAKVRGQESLGMLCSAKELGLSEEHRGILEISGDIDSGVDLVQALGLDDVMIEIDLTPNRPDCASVLGIAREVAGFAGRKLRPPVSREELPALAQSHPEFSVEIREADLCPRYAARKLSGVTIAPSPKWLQQRLQAVGMRPINNIVDITNYVMLELGQPLHAFDFARLTDGRIVVRCPREGERQFTTLDGQLRNLEPDMLMICDGERPVAVAGIMGGLESEVIEGTREILLESACFNPVSIRRTARRLNIASEASYRFERGIDPNGVDIALERAVRLMVELAGAKLVEGGVDLYPGRRSEHVQPLRCSRVRDLLGMELGEERITDLLRSIQLGVTAKGEGVLEVTIPSFRVDIEREVDLVEEIARLAGYNSIPTSLPQIGMDYPKRDPLRTLRQEISRILVARGFTEAINYSFSASRKIDQLQIPIEDRRRKVTRLLNPLAEEQEIMRSLLLPGLLDNIRHNHNHQWPDVALFETGKIFAQLQRGVLPEERLQLCAVLSGKRHSKAAPLYFSNFEADIFDLKGVVESIFHDLSLTGMHGKLDFVGVSDKVQPYCQEGFTILIRDGGTDVGLLGKINQQVLRAFGIKQDVYFLEMDLNEVNALPRVNKVFQSLPRFPAVKRDIALIVPEPVAAGELIDSIILLDEKIIEDAELFDVYRGKPVEKGRKSVAIAVTYRSPDKTLDDETVDIVHEKIVNTLMSRFGGRYRD